MGMFDQNARQAAKLDGGGFFGWVFARFQPRLPLAFHQWDDTRRLPLPGGPDRTDDLLAVLSRSDAPEQTVHQIVEFETEPEALILSRLGIYELMLLREVRPPPGPDGMFPIGSILVNLTGSQPETELELGIAGTGKGSKVGPVVIDLAKEDAVATLADIAAGRLALCILAWVPLMAGGGQPALIEEWKRIALAEPDAERRSTYRDLALVFAELTRELVNWQQALEGWEMKESQYIKGWLQEGETRGAVKKGRADLLKVLRARLPDPIPEPIRLAIEGTNDPETLDRWLDAALSAATWADVRAAMKVEE